MQRRLPTECILTRALTGLGQGQAHACYETLRDFFVGTMKHFRRVIFAAISGMSLLLCIAIGSIWVRSYSVEDTFLWTNGNPPLPVSTIAWQWWHSADDSQGVVWYWARFRTVHHGPFLVPGFRHRHRQSDISQSDWSAVFSGANEEFGFCGFHWIARNGCGYFLWPMRLFLQKRGRENLHGSWPVAGFPACRTNRGHKKWPRPAEPRFLSAT